MTEEEKKPEAQRPEAQRPEAERHEAERPEAERLPEEQVEEKEDFQRLIRGKYREAYLRQAAELLAAQAAAYRRYERYRAIRAEAEALKKDHPDFDLGKELENARFAALVHGGASLSDAYALVHREELGRSDSVRSAGAAQPLENGVGKHAAAAVCSPDPRSLTPKERRQLLRRAAKGETIIW